MKQFHPEFHPGAKSSGRDTLQHGSIPRPAVVPPDGLEPPTRGLGNGGGCVRGRPQSCSRAS
jgi:hypothetical protein